MLTESHVIIVDDNRDLVDNWAEILSDRGARVRTALSGQAARELASEPFDVALVDLRLPDVVGTTLVPELHAASRDSEVLLITGHGSVEDAIDAVRADVYDYLLKPVAPSDLLARVERACQHVRTKREATQLRENLRRESRFNEQLVETAQVIILVLDPRGRMVRFNPYMEELTGYRSEEVRGRDWFETFIPEGERARIRDVFESAVAGTVVRGNVNPILTKSGEERFIEWSAQVLTEGSGAIAGVLSTGIDVTDRRRAEAEIRHGQKMEAVGALASGVAHDFNNLLMGILGCTDLALRELGADSEARRYLGEVRAAASNGASIVKQLLSFARKDAEQPTAAWIEPDALLGDMHTLMSRLSGEDVTITVRRGAPAVTIQLDPGQLDQVLLNLVVNARHAMQRGGHLTLETKVVGVGDDPKTAKADLGPGLHLELSVRDTGCGMPPAVRERVFEPFFTTKGPEQQGTGLGLSTIYGIVKRAHGHIEVDSEVGVGTEFRIYFPAEHRPASESEASLRSSALCGNETVLVVEDERLVRMTLEHRLQEAGYHALMAADGREALGLMQKHGESIDAVLTDMVLPNGLSGVDLHAQIKSRIPGVPVIFMSAHPKHVLARDGRIQRGAEFLEKPFTERALLEKLRRLLDESLPDPFEGRAQIQQLPAAGRLPPPSNGMVEMVAPRPPILVVEDEAAARLAMVEVLRSDGYAVVEAESAEQALALFRSHDPPILLVLADFGLPDMPGDELVRKLRQTAPELGVIYVTGRSADDPRLEVPLSFARTLLLTKPVELAAVEAAVGRLAAMVVPSPATAHTE